MSLLGFLVNYEDPEQRKSMPSGLLVTHERNPVIIGLGESPLSTLLAGLFLSGIEYPAFDKHQQHVKKRVKPKDLSSFRAVGCEYLKLGRLKLSEIQIEPPLSAGIKVSFDLKLSNEDAPFEFVKLRTN